MKLAAATMAALVFVFSARNVLSADPFEKYRATLRVLSLMNLSSGPCTSAQTEGNAHAQLCSNGDTSKCYCATFSGSYSGTAGVGDMNIVGTVDSGNGTSAYNMGCSPFSGVLYVNGSLDYEVMEISGGLCDNPPPFTKGGFIGPVSFSIAGTCVMTSSGRFPNGAMAFCSGLIDDWRGRGGRIHLSGVAERCWKGQSCIASDDPRLKEK